MDCVVAPVDQTFPVDEEEVRMTLPPVQKVVGPLAVMTGVSLETTVIAVEGSEVHPLEV